MRCSASTMPTIVCNHPPPEVILSLDDHCNIEILTLFFGFCLVLYNKSTPSVLKNECRQLQICGNRNRRASF